MLRIGGESLKKNKQKKSFADHQELKEKKKISVNEKN
jgi:hypothetical protein